MALRATEVATWRTRSWIRIKVMQRVQAGAVTTPSRMRSGRAAPIAISMKRTSPRTRGTGTRETRSRRFDRKGTKTRETKSLKREDLRGPTSPTSSFLFAGVYQLEQRVGRVSCQD